MNKYLKLRVGILLFGFTVLQGLMAVHEMGKGNAWWGFGLLFGMVWTGFTAIEVSYLPEAQCDD